MDGRARADQDSARLHREQIWRCGRYIGGPTKDDALRIVAEAVKFAEASEMPSSYQDLMQNTYVQLRPGTQNGGQYRRRYRLIKSRTHHGSQKLSPCGKLSAGRSEKKCTATKTSLSWAKRWLIGKARTASTRGFLEEFGERRVRDTPISEMAIGGRGSPARPWPVCGRWPNS